MPHFCSYPYTLTPREYWQTTCADFLALIEHREQLAKEGKRER